MRISGRIIKRALYEAEMLDIGALELLPELPGEPSERFKAAMGELLDRERIEGYRRIKWKKAITAAIAAAIIATMLTMIAYGKEIVGFIVKFYEDHIGLTSDDSGYVIEVEYRAGYIPDGYTQTYYHSDIISVVTRWELGERYIKLTQDPGMSRVTIDSTDSSYRVIYSGEMAIHTVQKNNTTLYVWNDGRHAFSLYFSYYESDDVAMMIIDGLTPIK